METNSRYVLFDLEVDLHETCNLKCAQCTHASPYFDREDEKYSIEQFTKDVNILSNVCSVNVMRIVGGEPLLNKNLTEFVKSLKNSKLTNIVTLFTNGLLLNVTNKDIFEYIDRLRVSYYSNLTENQVNLISKNCKQVRELFPNLDMVVNEMTYFSQFNLLEENTNKDLVEKIYNNCYYSYEDRGLSIFNGRLYKCFASRKKYKYLKAHNKLSADTEAKLNPNIIDSIAIDSTLTLQSLKEFLDNRTPLEGCKWCLGTCGKQIKHKQIETIQNDVATIQDLDFEAGASYISNNILSWNRFDKSKGDIIHNKFFNIKYLKDYIKQFKFNRLF